MRGIPAVTTAALRRALIAALSGALLACAPHRPADAPHPPSSTRPEMTIRAKPAYRLIVNPAFADLPSRLVVLHARIETSGPDRLRVSPQGMDLRLADGTVSRAFDRAKALALLERTELAVWNLDYARDDQHRYPPGGLKDPTRKRVKEAILEHLLSDVDLTQDQPAEGYFIVDTQVPVTSLAGARLGVSARRLGDAASIRDTFEFAGPEQTSTRE